VNQTAVMNLAACGPLSLAVTVSVACRGKTPTRSRGEAAAQAQGPGRDGTARWLEIYLSFLPNLAPKQSASPTQARAGVSINSAAHHHHSASYCPPLHLPWVILRCKADA
jgi:hypothetical protein